ncbi:MAG TPA: hypothetical protein VJ999_04805 [Candidatus Sulfotelmatobacter sp.]|nr:hypothetical protein [Candidatus Sulfotelmatobacter sp.]
MSPRNWLYRGPKAWLVWLNLLVACVALVPSFLECSLWLLRTGGLDRPLGEFAAFPEVFGGMLLIAIAENAYIVCVPVLLACVLLVLLVRTPAIPSRVRTITAVLVTVALIAMLVNVGVLYLQYQHGRWKFI